MALIEYFPPITKYPHLGSHLSNEGCDLPRLFLEATKYEQDSFQFFLTTPRMMVKSKYNRKNFGLASVIAEMTHVMPFVHACFLCNLNGTKDKTDAKYEINYQRVIEYLKHELDVCVVSGVVGMVVHGGSCKEGLAKNIERICNAINKCLTDASTITEVITKDFKLNPIDKRMLILENSAGQGTTIGSTIAELKLMIDGVKRKNNIGICIDTCHLFCRGEYDIRQVSEIERFFVEFEKEIGIKYIKIIHLNDSCKQFASKKDVHARIGQGYIWSDSNASLKKLIEFAIIYSIPLVLETTPHDLEYMKQTIMSDK